MLHSRKAAGKRCLDTNGGLPETFSKNGETMKSDFYAENKRLLVEWNSRYAVHIPLIDEQHKKLIDLTNQLYDACLVSGPKADAAFKSAAHSVADYTRYHFSAEEKMLAILGYPDLVGHKKEHEILIKGVLENVRHFEEGKKFVPNAFARTIKDWILTHIAHVDKQYSIYILALKKEGKLPAAFDV